MTPRRYFASTLTVDNRDLASQAENLTDEAHALRTALREARAEIVRLKADYASLEARSEELAELVRQRDEQISSFKSQKELEKWDQESLTQTSIDRSPVQR